jgi:hypothetical protein
VTQELDSVQAHGIANQSAAICPGQATISTINRSMTRDTNRAQRDGVKLVSLADVEEAAKRLRGRIIKTPLLTSTVIDEHISKLVSPPEGPAIDVKICFKAEHLQLTG